MAYKWSSPQEWLIQYAGNLDANKLFQEFTVLVQKMDGDMIQDLYESDMDKDGFFTPIREFARYFSAAYPGEVFTVEEYGDEFQTVYPALLADHGAIFETETEAWTAIRETVSTLGITLTT